jgi:predicted GIY-YIG superfamily endonuclease
MAIVYQHIDVESNLIFYIGIGKNNNRAFSKHSRGKFWKDYTKNKIWKSEILFENITWQEACTKEIELISKIGRRDFGLGTLVNQTDGGDGVQNPSDEARRKNGIAHIGQQSWCKGLTKDTDERVAKISKKLTNRERSQDHCKNISLAKKGKPNEFIRGENNPAKRLEVREKNRLAHLGNKNWLGKKHSENTKIKQRQKALNREKIICEKCQKIIDKSNYSRWHGNKCKNI